MSSSLYIQGAIGGNAISGSINRTGGGGENHTPALPAATAGVLSTRTDADTGVVTVADGHDLVTGKVDVYWNVGGVKGKRIGMDAVVTDTHDTTVTIDSGAGDNLPALSSAVTIANQVALAAVNFDGDDVKLAGVSCDQRASITLLDSGGATIITIECVESNDVWYWADGKGIANPLTGNAITHATASNASLTAATLRMGVELTS